MAVNSLAHRLHTVSIACTWVDGLLLVDEVRMDFWQLLEVLGKRKWLIFLSAIVAVGLTFFITSIVGQKWQATVQFIAPDSPNDTNQDIAQANGDNGNPADPA